MKQISKKTARLWVAAIFLAAPLLASLAMAGSMPADVALLGRELAGCLARQQRARIAVTGIRTLEGAQNGFTVWLEDVLAAELVRRGAGQVLERQRLEELIVAVRPDSEERFDPETAVEVGRLANADSLVTGTVARSGDTVALSLRAVDCATGAVLPGCAVVGRIALSTAAVDLWQRRARLMITVLPAHPPADIYMDDRLLGRTGAGGVLVAAAPAPGRHVLRGEVPGRPAVQQTVDVPALGTTSVLLRLQPALKVSFWQEEAATGRVIGNGGTVHTGRQYSFKLRANRDCWVYLFNLGSSGRIHAMRPAAGAGFATRVAAGATVRIPATGAYPLGGPPGSETIYVVAGFKRLQQLERIAADLKSGTDRMKAFQDEFDALTAQRLTKDYGPPAGPAVAESVALNPDAGIVMAVRYRHR